MEDTPYLNLDNFRENQNGIVALTKSSESDLISILRSLNLENLNSSEKALIIQKYLTKNILYTPDRPMTIEDILRLKKGNCYSHALIGLVMLRLVGVEAKFGREMHLYKRDDPNWRNRDNNLDKSWLWGAFHNDHTYCFFRNNELWEPFDSAIGLCGLDEFYSKRSNSVSPALGQLMSPPFIIWSVEKDDRSEMKNVTQEIWDETNNLDSEWKAFMNNFKELSYPNDSNKLMDNYLKDQIKNMALNYFQ